MRCSVLHNILHKTNDFLTAKAKAMLPLSKPISKKKSPYTDISNKKDPIDIDEKISNKSEVVEMPEVKHIIPKIKYITSTQSRSRIQSIQIGFKLIEFDDGIRGQVSEPINKKNTMAYMTDILIDQNNNYLPFKNNGEYI